MRSTILNIQSFSRHISNSVARPISHPPPSKERNKKENLPGSSLAVPAASWANARIRLNKTALSLRQQAILLSSFKLISRPNSDTYARAAALTATRHRGRGRRGGSLWCAIGGRHSNSRTPPILFFLWLAKTGLVLHKGTFSTDMCV